MSLSWRNNSVTAVALFLETCALYLVFAALGAVLNQPGIVLPFWLVLLALVSSYLLMGYILSVKVTPRIRGLIGLGTAVPAMLIMTNLNTGFGMVPVNTLISGDVVSTVAIIGTLVFLVVVWWRGSTVAQEDMSLDAVRAAFLWGLGVLFVTSLVDSMVADQVVNGFLVVGFFAVGLLGLSLARFSSESGETHTMSMEWVMPILVSVGAVVVLGLVISAIGLGGLDEVTRETVRFLGAAGFWLLRPVLLLMGLFAGVIVGFGNWIAGMFGQGDFTSLMDAQQRLNEFHEGLRAQSEQKEPSTALVTILKWTALAIASTIGGYLVYRLFRSRRFRGQEDDVEETRESLFTWRRANDDLAGMLSGWWNRMFPVQEKKLDGGKQPTTPREFYHGFLGLATRLGRPRRDSETPNEHQRGIWGLLPTDPVYRIVQRFQRSHYGRSETDDTGIEDLRKDWKEINDFVDSEDL